MKRTYDKSDKHNHDKTTNIEQTLKTNTIQKYKHKMYDDMSSRNSGRIAKQI